MSCLSLPSAEITGVTASGSTADTLIVKLPKFSRFLDPPAPPLESRELWQRPEAAPQGDTALISQGPRLYGPAFSNDTL